jgi:hypothetical protein
MTNSAACAERLTISDIGRKLRIRDLERAVRVIYPAAVNGTVTTDSRPIDDCRDVLAVEYAAASVSCITGDRGIV